MSKKKVTKKKPAKKLAKKKPSDGRAILYSRVWGRTKAFIMCERKRLKFRSVAAYLNNHFGEKKRKQSASKSK